VIDASIPRKLGLFCNEYLYYFYKSREALASMKAEPECRGELVQRLNSELLRDLDVLVSKKQIPVAMKRYESYHQKRSDTYMDYARVDGGQAHEFEIEGYAGVALDFLDSLSGEGVRIGLNVANNGAIDFLADDDVVEISCDIGGGSYKPVKAPPMPAEVRDLIVAVKKYERFAVESIERRSRDAAIAAMMAHPLVASEVMSLKLYKAFSDAQPQYFKGWK